MYVQIHFALGLWFTLRDASALPIIPNLKTDICYGFHGDVNIAVMGPTTHFQSGEGNICSDEINLFQLSYTEGAVWTTKQINTNPDVLPNLTLGFVVLNTCQTDRAALARSLFLIPDTCDSEIKGGSCTGRPQEKFKVFGVVGPSSSREAVLAASFLNLFQIPCISPTASSDVLSDKSLYEYFLRVVPPDRFQMEALMSFLEHMGWSYVSLLYSEGDYGENAYKLTVALAKKKSICLPVLEMLPIIINEKVMDGVIDILLQNIKARVVLLYINQPHQILLFSSIERLGLIGTFIWVSGDYMYERENGPPASGAFVSTFISTNIPAYDAYFNSLAPITDGSLWQEMLWEQTYGCKWDRSSSESCFALDQDKREPFQVSPFSSLYSDAANAHALALHNMFSKECPEVFRDKTLISDCLKGSVYLQYLRNVSFDGHVGKVQFDQQGDSAGRYIITQYAHDTPKAYTTMAYVDFLSDTFDIYTDKINWNYFKQDNIGPNGVPESLCSKDCKEKEYAIRQELICCWECRTCRENEILAANKSKCDKCPLLYWPDDATQTICEKIPPVFLQWADVPCVVLLSLDILGFLLCLSSYAWILRNWNEKLVKATSRDLSSFTLAGCMLAFATVFAFIAKPSEISCYISRIGFNLSVAMIFAPLLLKTNRVYRIFQAGKSGNTKPALIGNRVQMVFTLVFVGIQVVTSIVTSIIAPPKETEEMKVPTEKYVEVYCDLPMVGLLPPLAINITIILLCMFFGFLTRKLPENFNETWYIFVSGSTTMFLWVVFLPTYFTTFYATHKAILLAACLIINGILTIICLFVPKMYALRFLDEEMQNAKGVNSTTGTAISAVNSN